MTGADHSTPPGPFAHKIRPDHPDRLAVVYVRQSTPQQVAEDRESADLQYQLRRRAVELGWAEPRVLIIDDDQGCSGQSIDNRSGLQRLLAEISPGHVGIVFGREMSRLARSNRAWHKRLELCGLFRVLPADADGVYDPRDVNDRLLGLSEAETHVLRTRLLQGNTPSVGPGPTPPARPRAFRDRAVGRRPRPIGHVSSRTTSRLISRGNHLRRIDAAWARTTWAVAWRGRPAGGPRRCSTA